MDLRQVALFAIALAVPLIFFWLRSPRLVLGWVGITLAIHLFDTQMITNLPAGRVVGLLYMPQALAQARSWLRLKPVAAWAVSFAYLVLLGLVFGYIMPWQDASGTRVFSTTPHGRAIVYPIRLLADASLCLFVAQQCRKPGNLLYLAMAMVIGSTLSALVGVINLGLPGFDPYFWITGLRDLNGIQLSRSRGLSFEPRVLGLACAYSLMILALYPRMSVPKRAALILINLLGLLVSYSSSAFIVLIIGIPVVWGFLTGRMRRMLVGMLLSVPLIVFMLAVVLPARFETATKEIQQRLISADRLQGVVPQNLAEMIAWKFDSFDASALMFLISNPQYAMSGTGPGMVMLPASNYIPPGIFTEIYGQNGLDGLPTLGLLLEISNGGLIAAGLWAAQVYYCGRALRRLSRSEVSFERAPEWQFGRGLFAVGVAFFLVQTMFAVPHWSIILAIGWAAASLNVRSSSAAADALPAASSPEHNQLQEFSH